MTRTRDDMKSLWGTWELFFEEYPDSVNRETVPLYASPQPTAQVPEGWKVHEPTPGVIKIEKEGAGYMHVRRGIDYNPFKTMAVLQALAEDMLTAAPSIAEKREWPTALEEEPPEDVELLVYFAEEGPWIARWSMTLQRFCVAQPSDVGQLPAGARWQKINPPGLRRPEPPEMMND